ncbi:Usher syndrome type-1C protein-binding protein 1 [Apodemus speciosus]|uniref:Usher syndrome type-1C protein-binding protein 1 n=1 Tax=Apodemus speciosus TaxID=105296 RepID=A0ABQ0F1Z6_APOSI
MTCSTPPPSPATTTGSRHRPILQSQAQGCGFSFPLAQLNAEALTAALVALEHGQKKAVEALQRLNAPASEGGQQGRP